MYILFFTSSHNIPESSQQPIYNVLFINLITRRVQFGRVGLLIWIRLRITPLLRTHNFFEIIQCRQNNHLWLLKPNQSLWNLSKKSFLQLFQLLPLPSTRYRSVVETNSTFRNFRRKEVLPNLSKRLCRSETLKNKRKNKTLHKLRLRKKFLQMNRIRMVGAHWRDPMTRNQLAEAIHWMSFQSGEIQQTCLTRSLLVSLISQCPSIQPKRALQSRPKVVIRWRKN